jgi:3-oxoacyl-[acyl-carrier protein] reductase
MAQELGPAGIYVNVIGPGLTKTDATAGLPAAVFAHTAEHTPLLRVAEPQDIASVIMFLASEMSDYITGQYIPVNGGGFML